MVDDVDDAGAEAGEAAGQPTDDAGDAPLVVWADTMPAPVPSVDDGHPVELGAPRAIRPKWYDLLLGNLLCKAVSVLNADGGRMVP